VVVVDEDGVEDVAVEEVADSRDDVPHAVATEQSATRPATAKPSLRLSTFRV
jgi:hypothetical protein